MRRYTEAECMHIGVPAGSVFLRILLARSGRCPVHKKTVRGGLGANESKDGKCIGQQRERQANTRQGNLEESLVLSVCGSCHGGHPTGVFR